MSTERGSTRLRKGSERCISGRFSATSTYTRESPGLFQTVSPRTPLNRGKSKGRSPDMEPRPSARAAYVESTVLLNRELPALGLVARYVRLLVEGVARRVLRPGRHRGFVGLTRAEVASRVEDRLLSCGIVADGGRNLRAAVGVELDQLEGRGGSDYGRGLHVL